MSNIKYKLNIKNVIWMYSYINNANVDFEILENGDFGKNDLSAILEKVIFKELNKIVNGIIDTKFCQKEFTNQNIKGNINFDKSMLGLQQNIITYRANTISYNTEFNKLLKFLFNLYYKNNTVWNKISLDVFDHVDVAQFTPKEVIKLFDEFNYHYNEINIPYKRLFNWFKILFTFDVNGNDSSLKLDFDALEYEAFIGNFFKRELSSEFKVETQKKHSWNSSSSLFPKLITDIEILKDKIPYLIIDTKYYKNIVSTNQYNVKKLSSDNLFQMNAYLDNVKRDNLEFYNGMLLYATDSFENYYDEHCEINNTFKKIYIKTINLNDDINNVKTKLLDLICFD